MTSIRADMTELRCNLGWDRATSCTEGCHSKRDDAITTRWIEDQEQSSGVEAWCGVLEVLRQGLWDDMGLNGGVYVAWSYRFYRWWLCCLDAGWVV
jgi:hypothetical protein